MKLGRIYKVTCLINQKIYIGQTVATLAQRRTNHQCQAKRNKYKSHFHLALLSHGPNFFSWETIEENIPHGKLLNDRETYYITLYDSVNPEKGYNLTLGGESGPVIPRGSLSEEHRRKIGDANRGRKYSDALKMKMREKSKEVAEKLKLEKKEHWNKGRRHSEEQNKKHAEWLTNHPTRKPGDWLPSEETRKLWSEQRKGKAPPNKGKPMSEDQKEKIRVSLLKRNHT